MATLLIEPLRDRFAALQAERARNWPPAQLEANAAIRHQLVDRFDPADVAQSGDSVPPLSFIDVGGDTLTLDGLTANGPALLLLFRFATCPADNIALPYYAEALLPALAQRNIPLVALSPQISDRLREIKQRHALPFPVATDADNGLARLLNVAFRPDDRPSPPPAGWIGEVTGTNSWELPQPTFLLVGPNRIIEWIHVSPDWLDRPEAADILRQL
jgi:peroxiredoxin